MTSDLAAAERLLANASSTDRMALERTKNESTIIQCSNYGGGGRLAPLVQALPQTPIIGLRSAIAIRPPENFLIIRPLPSYDFADTVGGETIKITKMSHHVTAPSISATMSKQHCRMLQVERFFRQCRMLLRHCCSRGRGLTFMHTAYATIFNVHKDHSIHRS